MYFSTVKKKTTFKYIELRVDSIFRLWLKTHHRNRQKHTRNNPKQQQQHAQQKSQSPRDANGCAPSAFRPPPICTSTDNCTDRIAMHTHTTPRFPRRQNKQWLVCLAYRSIWWWFSTPAPCRSLAGQMWWFPWWFRGLKGCPSKFVVLCFFCCFCGVAAFVIDGFVWVFYGCANDWLLWAVSLIDACMLFFLYV